jgi:hypothetical protein
MELKIYAKFITLSSRIFTPRVSWVKASDEDVNNYCSALSQSLTSIKLPAAAMLCTDMCCKDVSHYGAIGQYSQAITKACLSAAESNISHASDRHTESKRVPGWNERVEHKRQISLFWHGLWVDCGRPRNGVVADCMRRTRANYRQVKREEDLIARDRIANALIDDPRSSFWTQVKKIRNNKACSTKIFDGCTDGTSIAPLFANKYRNLFSSVTYNATDMLDLLAELDARVGCDRGLSNPDHIFIAPDVADTM